MVIIVIGVSGSGKTTIGQRLAHELSFEFYDADDFHSPANREKMRQGIALTDADRAPWLSALSDLVDRLQSQHKNGVLACSALKQVYRNQLSRPEVRWVYLRGDYDLIRSRLENRAGHFFDPELLGSQFAALEEPRDAVTVDVDATPERIVQEIRSRLGLAHS
jgi:gluconokinase